MAQSHVGDVMTSAVVSTGPTTSYRQLARLLATHVSRTDLLRVFLRDDDQIAAEVTDGLRQVFVLDPQSIVVQVREGVVTLRGELPRAGLIELVAAWVADLDGVVGVHSLLRTPPTANHAG
jgi:osmotically-inducible protein OsmY